MLERERAVCIMNHGFSPSKSHKRLLTSDIPGIRDIKEETKEETTPNHRIHPTPRHKQAHSTIAISNDSTHIFTVTHQRIAYTMPLCASQRELPRPPHRAEVSVACATKSLCSSCDVPTSTTFAHAQSLPQESLRTGSLPLHDLTRLISFCLR